MLRVIGAGLGRTGTTSLKVALAQLLAAPCYHMEEAAEHPDHSGFWRSAVAGERVDWNGFLGGYGAIADWPGCSFWRELSELNPQALILLSERADPETWWSSYERTVARSVACPAPGDADLTEHREMIRELFAARFTPRWQDRDAAIAAYVAHGESVRRECPPERLLIWQPGEGWEPICGALGLPVPATPFPRENSASVFRERLGLDR